MRVPRCDSSRCRVPAAPAAPARVLCLLAAAVPLARAQSVGHVVRHAKAAGLKGYDLVDRCDVWFGRNGAPYEAPVQVIDALGDSNGRATIEDWRAAGLPEAHFAYFDRDGDKVLSDAEANTWFFQRKSARTMNLSEMAAPPRGHLEHLGAWKDPLPSADLVYEKPYPHPRDFWRKHMDGYLPAVLKGAQHGWPAMNWTKEALAERFGWVHVKLEPKVEARGNHTAYHDLDSISRRHRLTVEEYLKVEQGRNVYVVSILPQAMAWEVAHPSVLLCGSRRKILDRSSRPPYNKSKHRYPNEMGYPWMTHVFEANLWIASGFTRSQLHYDKEWNVNCLLSGKKRWFFLNPFWYDDELQWARGKKFRKDDPLNNHWTDWVYLDPDHVDLIVQHKLRNMDYYELIQEPGDCLLVPYAMLHQVEKLGDDLQVAASWMFLPETIYEEEDCAEAPLEEDLPLAVMDTLYAYAGKGIIPQGYPDPLDFVKGLVRRMDRKKEKVLTLETLAAAVSQGDSVLATVKDKQRRIKSLFDLLTSYAADPAVGLSIDELISSVPLRVWCKPAAEGDEEGPLPCDHGEEYFILGNEETAKMKAHINKRLERRQPSVPEEGLEGKTKTKGPRPIRVYDTRPPASRQERHGGEL